MWAAHATKMGFMWHVGDGRKVRFWEDCWFGSCSLAIQYWEIFTIVNEQGSTIREAWDGVNLRFTFRRTEGERLMAQWMDLEQIASSIRLNDEHDAMIWHFNSIGKFSVQSLYGVVTDRGIKQIFTPGRLLCRLEFMYFYGF
jgi:hypothetical protein